MRRELLLGCGANWVKKMWHPPMVPHWHDLTTLDMNPDHHPTVVWNLDNLPLPFEDNSFDEIHAYDVLEHQGSPGNFEFFFAQFSDFARMLRPNGFVLATVPGPNCEWTWGDPGHRRVIHPNNLIFLSQRQYEEQVGKTTMTDYRYLYKADFEIMYSFVTEDGMQYRFILQVKK